MHAHHGIPVPASTQPVHAPRSATAFAGHLFIAAAALALAACAGIPAPVAQMAVSEAAIEHASAAGAAEFAAIEMASARDHMQRARSALAGKDHAGALSLAQAAEVDAQLAEARAGASRAARTAGEATEGTRVLREEIQRNNRQQP